MQTETIRYIFYIDGPNKFRRYLTPTAKWSKMYDEAARYSYFRDGLNQIIKLKFKDGFKPGYVKISEILEFREVKL